MDLLEIATTENIPELIKWLRKPTFTDRALEKISERQQHEANCGRPMGNAPEDYIAILKRITPWLDQQKVADCFAKMQATVEALAPESDRGGWAQMELLRILKLARVEIDEELNDLNGLLWELSELAKLAKWGKGVE